MKVTLICPEWKNRGLTTVPFFRFPPQALFQLAALTPLEWDVVLVDANDTPIDFDAPTDCVGITAMTALAPGAYKIAAEYRRRGVPTIMGGIHASFLPDEAAQHVDCVVTGEADLLWPHILHDVCRRQLRSRYDAEFPRTLDFPIQRQISTARKLRFGPLLSRKFGYLQAMRGCPVGCGFCSVTKFNGAAIRKTNIDTLLEYIEWEKSNGVQYFVFVDDNIIAHRGYAEMLFKALESVHIQWVSQTDIRIAGEEILPQALRSGLAACFLGLESITPDVLSKDVGRAKEKWAVHYASGIRRLRENGVIVEGSFIFGLEGEDRDVVTRTIDWAKEQGIDLAQFSVLTPLPGTELFQQLLNEGRILTTDWSRYNTFQCCFQPRDGRTPKQLERHVQEAYASFYEIGSIVRRLNPRQWPTVFAASLVTNLAFRRFRA